MKERYRYKKTDRSKYMRMFSKFGDKSVARSSGDEVIFYDLCHSCSISKIKNKIELLKLLDNKDFIICKRKGKWVDLNKDPLLENIGNPVDINAISKALNNVVKVIKVFGNLMK